MPPRSIAVPSEAASGAPTQRDRHLQVIAERGLVGWQKASDYNKRALAEPDISRWTRMTGDGLHPPTEVAIAVNVLSRMLEMGRPS